MTPIEAIQNRHSVRQYTTRKIVGDIIAKLNEEINICNAESGLNIQLITNESAAFGGFMAVHYGDFSGVSNYIALIGKKITNSNGENCLQEKAGYYGERVVIKAQQLGLNTCWVSLTYSKGKCAAKISKSEKLVCVISLGYGVTPGIPRKSKSLDSLCKIDGKMPGWFREGMEAATLAPTAMNQQKFLFTLTDNNTVKADITGGIMSKIDLGIVKYHFEIGAGKNNFSWA